VQREVAQQVKELRAKRQAERDPAERKALDDEIEAALAKGRADMEAMVRQLHPTLQPVRPSESLYKIVESGREYFGTLEVLLDFKPPPKATHELGDRLFSQGSQTADAKVSATGGMAGTSAQGRVNKFPGDIDLAESVRIEAKDAHAAGEALARTVQHTVATATKPVPGKPPIIFEGMAAGTYPKNHPQAGKRIQWEPHEVAAGQKKYLDKDGNQQVITLAQALGHPGDRVANTFWKGPLDAKETYGEVTKVIRYEAFDSKTGEKLFGTPSIGQGYQEATFGEPQMHDTNRAHLTDALAPEIGRYAQEGNWVKAVKRAHTVARMNGDMAALNDFAPLMSVRRKRRAEAGRRAPAPVRLRDRETRRKGIDRSGEGRGPRSGQQFGSSCPGCRAGGGRGYESCRCRSRRRRACESGPLRQAAKEGAEDVGGQAGE
jgi:hypothetical protein